MPRCSKCQRRLPYSKPCPTDGTLVLLEASQVMPSAPSVPGLRVETLIARGGFADVWRVQAGERTLALKVGRRVADSARFKREAAALQRLGSPLAPTLDSTGDLEDGRPYLGLEWLPSPTLATVLEAQDEPFTFDVAWTIAAALIKSTRRMVELGLLHRDLKPENSIWIAEPAPRMVLLDFGSCRFDDELESPVSAGAAAQSETGTALGTDDYMAPERIRGEPATERSELYSLGILLYELMTLRVPFANGRATLHAHLTLAPAPPSTWVELPPAAEQLILECLAKAPSMRPSLAELDERWRKLRAAPVRAAASPPTAVPSLGSAREARVVLWCGGFGEAERLANTIEHHHGFVARLEADSAIAVFGSSLPEDPVESALNAATSLLRDVNIRVALHVATLTLRRAPDGGRAAYGPAVDVPQSWLGSLSERVGVSSDFASAAGAERLRRFERETGALPTLPGEFRPQRSQEPAEPPLLGRGDVVAALNESLSRVMAEGSPGFVVISGELAMGKTRLASEAARLGAARGLHVVRISGRSQRDTQHWLAAVRSPNDTRSDSLSAAIADQLQRGALAFVLDDAHLVDTAPLEVLERVALSGAQSLWVVCAGLPSFVVAHPLFGARCAHYRRLELTALPVAAAQDLVARCLEPAEYVPSQALRQLAEAAESRPGFIVELCSALAVDGLIRARPETRSHYLDTSSLDRVPRAGVWQWLAARQLEPLEPAVAAGVKLVALLGPTFQREQLTWLYQRLGSFGLGTTKPDPEVLLESLLSLGFICKIPRNAGAYQFRSAPLASAIAALIAPDDLTTLHRLALQYHQEQRSADESSLDATARHALALGQRELARSALQLLGEGAASAQRLVDADARYSRALELCDDAPSRCELLIARAALRCRLYRLAEAAEDLESAAASARASDASDLECRALFELSTVLDWAGDYSASAEAADRAIQLCDNQADATLQSRALVAAGRSAWRRGDVSAAIAALERGLLSSQDSGCSESRVIALLLLGCALVQVGSPERAAALLDEVIGQTQAAGDALHLCAGLGNRAFVWATSGDVLRCTADLSRAVEVARQLGHPGTERTALLNLAEVLYWSHHDDQALSLLHQARALEDRFLHRPVHSAVLLLARLAVTRSDYAAVECHLRWLAERELPAPHASNAVAFTSALFHILQQTPFAGSLVPNKLLSWNEIRGTFPELLEEERMELSYLQAHYHRLAREEQNDERIAKHPVWGARLTPVSVQ